LYLSGCARGIGLMVEDRARVNVWRNTLTLVGVALIVISLFFIVTLSFFDFFARTANPNPYLGIFTFFVFPLLIVLGTGLAIGGFLLRRHRLRLELGGLSSLRYYPRLDLNDPRQQRYLAYLAGSMVLVLGFLGIMSYEGYHYTESNDFCGRVCHSVMHPEYTAHQYSPHARVNCVDCHIGSGAAHYVRAKMAGVRQIVAIITDDYPRPLPPALTVLRPSADTCEQCHWPKYFGEQLVTQPRFSSDEPSTPHTVRMIIKTGGSHASMGPVYGIHAHMVGERKIELIGTDKSFQEIPWVRVVDEVTGATRVYRSDGLPADAPAPGGLRRTMDCMDCHNRSVHTYLPPADSADTLLYRNPELRKLPFAKRALVEALTTPYDTRDDGLSGVPASLERYYREEHPDVIDHASAELELLMQAGGEIYRRTIFPDMKVDWRTYPSNVGHYESQGCFRCHAGQHVDESGDAIVSDCSTCHDFLVTAEDGLSVSRTDRWTHPVELEGIHADLPCSGCHSGGPMAEPTCEGCHAEAVEFMAGTLADFEAFEIEADVMDGLAECTECHDLSQRMSSKALNTACLDCHEGEDYAAPGTIAAQRREVTALFAAVTASNPESRRLLARLREAGPLHNLEATRKILRALSQE
jgi:nitrate/TMAO reductase-like tetraheme cytochrome c subunit